MKRYISRFARCIMRFLMSELPGCPHYCAKWALAKDEKDRTERDKQIVQEYKERKK